MKTFKIILLAVLVTITGISCSSSNASLKSADYIEPHEGFEEPDPTITLSEHLKRLPGVMVRGSGPTATITIRGINSITGSNEPLFVVNGQIIEGGYQAVASAISVHDIKTMKVLKDPSDTTLYGFRGANGVIEIKLKN